MDTVAQHNKRNAKLERWANRLSSSSHRALLMLLEGGHSGKEIALAVGIFEQNVSRIRKTYERLSGTKLPRLRLAAVAA